MRVLAFDTAGPVVGVAFAGPEGVFERTERVRRGAEARLLPWACAVCEDAGLDLRQIDLVAVATGPGAFTGLRVGLATAQGLSMSLGVPLVGLGALGARAARVESSLVLVMLDARKQRVYASIYQGGRCHLGPLDVPPGEAIGAVEALEKRWVATGEGALVYRGLIEAADGTVAVDADDPAVGVLATQARQQVGDDPGLVMPVYVRAPDAKKRAG